MDGKSSKFKNFEKIILESKNLNQKVGIGFGGKFNDKYKIWID